LANPVQLKSAGGFCLSGLATHFKRGSLCCERSLFIYFFDNPTLLTISIRHFMMRAILREALLPYVESGTQTVVAVQRTFRCKALDTTLPVIAWLGTEDAYTFLLPMFFIFNCWELGFWFVLIFAVANYASGALKDWLALPRPKSPPVWRAEANYTLEAGFPSTHTITSVSVALFVLAYTWAPSHLWFVIFAPILVLLISAIVFGRLYLGMHTPVDIVGAAILALAITCTAYSLHVSGVLVNLLTYNPLCSAHATQCALVTRAFPPIAATAVLGALLWAYPTPQWSSPSFTDALAFTAVANAALIAMWRTDGHGHATGVDASLFFWTIIAPCRIVVMVGLALPVKSVVRKALAWLLPHVYTMLGLEIEDRHRENGQDSSASFKVGERRPMVDYLSKYAGYCCMTLVMIDLCPLLFSLLYLDV
jgi:sphingosine-1-phosphate phosphatase 1